MDVKSVNFEELGKRAADLLIQNLFWRKNYDGGGKFNIIFYECFKMCADM